MNISSAKRKGWELENYVVQMLKETGLDPRASRNPGSGSGSQKGDIWNSLNLTIECKNTRQYPGKGEWEQAKREAVGGYVTPIIVYKFPGMSLDDSVVLIGFHDFLETLKKSREPKTAATESNQLQYRIRNAIGSLKALLKEIEP